MSIPALAVSSGIIILYCILASVARQIVGRVFHNGMLPGLFHEAIAAAELCACCFELIIIADNFGVTAYAVYLFLLTIWWGKVWGDATACPYTHMEDLLQGKSGLKEALLKMWAELMGGCCVYRIIQVIWWLELAETHKGRAFAECTADLQVTPYLGAFIEGFATLLCRLVSKSLAELSPKHGDILDAFIGTSLVVAAFNYSGGYFNPVLATSLKWGCAGHTNSEHIIVYWLGATTGAITSIPLFRVPALQTLLLDRKYKEE